VVGKRDRIRLDLPSSSLGEPDAGRLRGGPWPDRLDRSRPRRALGRALHNGQPPSQGEVFERELAPRPQARSDGRE